MVRRKKLTGISFQITRGPGGIRGCRKGGRIKKFTRIIFINARVRGNTRMRQGREEKKFTRIIYHQREGMWKYADGESIRLVFPRTLAFIKKNPRHVNLFLLPPFPHPRISLNQTRESREIRGCWKGGRRHIHSPNKSAEYRLACPGKWNPPTHVTYQPQPQTAYITHRGDNVLFSGISDACTKKKASIFNRTSRFPFSPHRNHCLKYCFNHHSFDKRFSLFSFKKKCNM